MCMQNVCVCMYVRLIFVNPPNLFIRHNFPVPMYVLLPMNIQIICGTCCSTIFFENELWWINKNSLHFAYTYACVCTVHVHTLCVSGLNSLFLRMSIFKFLMNRLHLSLSIGLWVCTQQFNTRAPLHCLSLQLCSRPHNSSVHCVCSPAIPHPTHTSGSHRKLPLCLSSALQHL